MSHTTTYAQKVKNVRRFCEIAESRGHKVRFSENNDITVQQYNKNWVENCAAEVHIKDWRFPLAVSPNGEVAYDHWGSPASGMDEFGRTLQAYNKAEIMSKLPMNEIRDYSIREMGNGDMKLVVNY